MLELNPTDIRKRKFKSRWVSGYDMDEVESFLDQVASTFEQFTNENEMLHEQVKGMEGELDDFRTKRKHLEDALISAQKVIDDMKTNARKEADNILKEAENHADRWISDANSQVLEIKRELHDMEFLRKEYEVRFRSLLESHLEQLNAMKAIPRNGKDVVSDQTNL
jgi:cell division initiation protein